MKVERDEIRERSRGSWLEICTQLGINASLLKRTHGPCPACGGLDRFRFDDKQGSGSFYCNNCGAGDGFKLVMNCFDCDFWTALTMVASVVSGGTFNSSPKRRHHNEPKCLASICFASSDSLNLPLI
jgi:putative DNA primase/helicase